MNFHGDCCDVRTSISEYNDMLSVAGYSRDGLFGLRGSSYRTTRSNGAAPVPTSSAYRDI